MMAVLFFSLTSCDNDISQVVQDVDISITSPQKGTIISNNPYELLEGTFTGTIPADVSMWVLAKDPFNYFLMYPETQIIRKAGAWSQSNVRLATPGKWELFVCLASKRADSWLHAYGKAGDYKGFRMGDVKGQLEIMASAKVTKR